MNIENQSEYTDMLEALTWELERSISNYVLQSTQDVIDEDNDLIVRSLEWERGNKSYSIVITPYGQIRYMTKDIPINLIHQVVNTNIETMWDIIGVEYDDGSRYRPQLSKISVDDN
tara:strand:+ start:2240 stop:2587 length:348 start_codon:yes stop_codon:yes gene_type:complete